MKKIIDTNFGIALISIIPSIISYLTAILVDFNQYFKTMSIYNHLPFILSMSLFLLIFGALSLRKWIKDTFKVYEEDMNLSNITNEFVFHKNFEIISKLINELNRNGIKVSPFEFDLSKAEESLVGSIDKYRIEKLKGLINLKDLKTEENNEHNRNNK
jgi:hypothetical protein